MLDVDGEITELDFCVNGGRFDTWEPVLDVTVTEEMCDDDQQCIDALGDMHDAYFCLPPEQM